MKKEKGGQQQAASINELIARVVCDASLNADQRNTILRTLYKMLPPPGTDQWVYRGVIITLGLTALLTVLGGFWLIFYVKDAKIPWMRGSVREIGDCHGPEESQSICTAAVSIIRLQLHFGSAITQLLCSCCHQGQSADVDNGSVGSRTTATLVFPSLAPAGLRLVT
jgi:hypothetical protein